MVYILLSLCKVLGDGVPTFNKASFNSFTHKLPKAQFKLSCPGSFTWPTQHTVITSRSYPISLPWHFPHLVLKGSFALHPVEHKLFEGREQDFCFCLSLVALASCLAHNGSSIMTDPPGLGRQPRTLAKAQVLQTKHSSSDSPTQSNLCPIFK